MQPGTISRSTVINGFNIETLSDLADALKENPDAGRVTFLGRSAWQDGGRVFTHFGGYTIDGERQHEQERQRVLLADEPVEFSGTDAAPGPVEQLLHAVGSCITATVNANAALMGVHLTRLEVALEGDLDLHGYFALNENVRPGLNELRVSITLAGDADEETLREIARRGYQYSTVRDSVEQGVTLRPNVVIAA